MTTSKQQFLIAALTLTSGFMAVADAQAGEVYTGVGIQGVMLGYAQPLSPSITVRGDYATFGNLKRQRTEDGIDYDARIKYSRFGLVGDWFFSGGWRLTGGITANNMKIDMVGKPNSASATINIGSGTYTYAAGDRLDVKVKFPSTTPYLGVGYGHQESSEKGFGFHFDLGASIGKAKVSTAFSGPSYNAMTAPQRAQLDADLQTESQELRDGVGKIKAIPQLSLGVTYRF